MDNDQLSSKIEELEEKIETIEDTIVALSLVMEELVGQVSEITRIVTSPPRFMPPPMF